MLDSFLIFHFFTLFLLYLGFDFLRMLASGLHWRLLLFTFLAIDIEHGMVFVRYPFKDSLNPWN